MQAGQTIRENAERVSTLNSYRTHRLHPTYSKAGPQLDPAASMGVPASTHRIPVGFDPLIRPRGQRTPMVVEHAVDDATGYAGHVLSPHYEYCKAPC